MSTAGSTAKMLPTLVQVAMHVDRMILQLGLDYAVTPALSAIARKLRCELVTLDQDTHAISEFQRFVGANPWHSLKHVPSHEAALADYREADIVVVTTRAISMEALASAVTIGPLLRCRYLVGHWLGDLSLHSDLDFAIRVPSTEGWQTIVIGDAEDVKGLGIFIPQLVDV